MSGSPSANSDPSGSPSPSPDPATETEPAPEEWSEETVRLERAAAEDRQRGAADREADRLVIQAIIERLDQTDKELDTVKADVATLKQRLLIVDSPESSPRRTLTSTHCDTHFSPDCDPCGAPLPADVPEDVLFHPERYPSVLAACPSLREAPAGEYEGVRERVIELYRRPEAGG
ncbi:hypothetical protein IAT38_005986 [Cryptococcus sp. DSM 104549]